jgi:ribonuclease T2
MLSLSYSPGFCKKLENNGGIKPEHQFQCSSNNSFNWVAHGLWAQSLNPGKCEDQKSIQLHPRYCAGDTIDQLPVDTIRKYMCTQPGASLLQSEWEKHGTCGDFSSAEQYFEKTQELFNALMLPEENLTPPSVFQWMKEHNEKLKNIRIGYDSKEIRVCYDKKWNYIDCPKN